MNAVKRENGSLWVKMSGVILAVILHTGVVVGTAFTVFATNDKVDKIELGGKEYANVLNQGTREQIEDFKKHQDRSYEEIKTELWRQRQILQELLRKVER